MFTRIKTFYKDHEEIIVTAAISTAGTTAIAAVALAMQKRKYKVINLGIDTDSNPDNIAAMTSINHIPMIVSLYYGNGTRQDIDMVPTDRALNTQLELVK